MAHGICPCESARSRVGIDIGCDRGTPSRWWIVCDLSRCTVGVTAGIASHKHGDDSKQCDGSENFHSEKAELSPIQARLRAQRQLWGLPRHAVT
jgi:hypothetical protein